jgi:hypothetical protein
MGDRLARPPEKKAILSTLRLPHSVNLRHIRDVAPEAAVAMPHGLWTKSLAGTRNAEP